MSECVAWMYVTDVCNRFEETFYTKEQAERMYREKILEIIPLFTMGAKDEALYYTDGQMETDS